MTKKEKAVIIQKLSEKFQSTRNFYITDASGLTVPEVNELRANCFEENVEYRVIKNTLIKKALGTIDADFTSLTEVLSGFSGIMFTAEEAASAPAKIIKNFKRKDNASRPKLKGASIDHDLFIGEGQLDKLAKLKSKTELIGEIVGLLQSPSRNVLSALQSGGNTLSGLVKALSER